MREERVIGLILVLSILLAACTQQRAPLPLEDNGLEPQALLAERQILFGGELSDAQFGIAVALDSNRMVVACECRGKEDIAYIFERTSVGQWPWKYVKTLKGRKATYTYSSYDVAISGDTVVVSSPEVQVVHIFQRDQGGPDKWGEVKQLTSTAFEGFGVSVDLSGDMLVVGAYSTSIGTTEYQGSAYVFTRNHGGSNQWGRIKQLTASDGARFDSFGSSVSISGDTVVVGAYSSDVGGNENQGSAYIFQKDQGGANRWGQVKKLTASDGLAGDWFGDAVDISDDTVVIGSPFSRDYKGSAYVFQRNHGGTNGWGQEKLAPRDSKRGDYFGIAVSIYKDTVVAGAVYSDDHQGSAYIFKRNQNGSNAWGQTQKVLASDGTNGGVYREKSDYFGASVAVSDRSVVVGAPLNDLGDKTDKGTVYVLE